MLCKAESTAATSFTARLGLILFHFARWSFLFKLCTPLERSPTSFMLS